ncbi:MAG TPA: hypothetical protein VIL97_07560 [Thermoanaerobaculia bacterium]
MKRWIGIALALMLVPMLASAEGFKDLDAAMSAISRGFSTGQSRPVVEGVLEGDKVWLHFAGLLDDEAYFGRDQVALLLDKLFSRVESTGFRRVSERKDSAENLWNVRAKWTFKQGEKVEERDLYISLANRDNRWKIVSIESR